MMRPAGKEDVYKMLVGEGEVSEDTSLDEFLDLYDILVSKGYSKQLAQKTAIDMMEGKEPKAQPSVRFAKINGDTSQNFGSSGDFNSST
jgi:hypothetical protein